MIWHSWPLLLSLMLLSSGGEALGQAPAQAKEREIVAYVADLSNPGQLVLADRSGVMVNDRTKYWVQPADGGKRRKGTINDVTIEHKVRIVVGPDNVAKTVTVFEGQ